MSSVLYYSKYCDNCKKLLYELGKTEAQKTYEQFGWIIK